MDCPQHKCETPSSVPSSVEDWNYGFNFAHIHHSHSLCHGVHASVGLLRKEAAASRPNGPHPPAEAKPPSSPRPPATAALPRPSRPSAPGDINPVGCGKTGRRFAGSVGQARRGRPSRPSAAVRSTLAPCGKDGSVVCWGDEEYGQASLP